MAKFNYARMTETASRLLSDFNQGTLIYIQPGEQTGPEYNPVTGPSSEYSISGTKASGSEKSRYVNDGYISSSDVLLKVAVFEVEPTMSGEVSINGRIHQIVMVDPVTNESPPVLWNIGCRA